jgi:hydroxymethylpyrimidine pyrophosphatase-like HAD family hydrolase
MGEKNKLLIFDFDGTALGGHKPYKQFPPEFAAFLDGLGSSGIQWATATTWGIIEAMAGKV